MSQNYQQIKQEFIEGLSQISNFWGFPKGMGAIFAVLYLSPDPLSLDNLVNETGLTKGAVSTNVRALARLGLVHRSVKLGDRKDYYEAETDFWSAVISILRERENSEFDRAVGSVTDTLQKLSSNPPLNEDTVQWNFSRKRVQELQDFFDGLDGLVRATISGEKLGLSTIQKIIKILK